MTDAEKVPILLVDDQPENLLAMESLLADTGVDIFKATSGNEALRLSLKQDFAIVLMDVRMPDMNGFEAAELLRMNQKTRHLPIIFVTAAMKDSNYQFKGYEAGAVDYLLKPIEPSIVRSKVRIFCDLYEQRRRIEFRERRLELLIEERTASLASAVKSLEGEIAERKRADEAMRKAKEAADDANRAKDRLLAVLSHELRTPLTPVLATVTALETQPDLSAELREEMQLIHRNVNLETNLINDLLDFTRLSRGKIQIHYEVVDAHACLHAALQVCQEQINARRLGVSLDLQARQHQVWADPARLQQVFWNLLQNAAKFTPEHGTIHLRSHNLNGRLQIQVQDSGIGIEPEMLTRIFDAFVQAEQTNARRYGGMGMGLSIAKSIMDLHHGQLTASSAGPNRGATFTVELPVLVSQPKPTAPAPVALPKRPQSLRILLVEDNADTLKVISRLLRKWGCGVTCAQSMHAALECATKERFDLLVSDLGLPDGSGLDIMRQLKQAYGLRGIAVSGYGMDEDLKQSQEAGFEKHLTKPLSFEALQAAVCEVVPGGAMNRQ